MRMDLQAVADHDPSEITDQQRDAAVLAPVIERDGEQHLLFIERAEDIDEHSGEVGFPGGGHEPEDTDMQATAIREVYEEIGMRGDEPEIVGRLDDIRTITGYAVTPFVARVPDRAYEPDGIEVADIAVLPLSALTDDRNYRYERYDPSEYEGREYDEYDEIVVHYFDVDGHLVWGATGRILVDLLELTTDWRAPLRMGTDLV
jgi:8-oxo-dGTP pyrophosphatase MutT (NUDIX family)